MQWLPTNKIRSRYSPIPPSNPSSVYDTDVIAPVSRFTSYAVCMRSRLNVNDTAHISEKSRDIPWNNASLRKFLTKSIDQSSWLKNESGNNPRGVKLHIENSDVSFNLDSSWFYLTKKVRQVYPILTNFEYVAIYIKIKHVFFR